MMINELRWRIKSINMLMDIMQHLNGQNFRVKTKYKLPKKVVNNKTSKLRSGSESGSEDITKKIPKGVVNNMISKIKLKS